MNRFFAFAFALLPLFHATRLRAAEADLPVASYVDDQTLAVARLDVGRVDVAAAVKVLETLLPPDSPEAKQQVAAAALAAQKLLDDFRKAGGQEVYALVSLIDIPQRPPLVIATVKPGGDPQALAGLLAAGPFEVREAVGNFVLCGTREQVQRVRAMTARPQPELVRALADGGPAALKLAAALPPESRRVVRETLAPLPAELGGLNGPQLVDGFQWAALSVELPPKPAFRLVIQSKDADAAKTLGRAIATATAHLRQQAEVRSVLPQVDEVVRGLLPQCEGNRLTLTLEQEKLQPLFTVLGAALGEARGAARRTRSMNNLRQIGLAMHVHHHKHECFPAQASYGPDSKKLLSWRVHLLPFLEQEALYRQFHLNEPWDSAHNRTLIDKLPSVFVSPQAPPNLAAKGMTTYLVPVGDKTVFSGRAGVPLARITDGTSNTIMVVEAHPSAAVIWTQPDDLAVNMQAPLEGLTGPPGKGFMATFCDGSVRFIPETVAPDMLRRALQMNDGEPVNLP